MKAENIRLRDHSPEELVFYSKATTDIEFAFPFGWGELWGIADRTDYDLTQHMNHSKQDLSYQDPETNEKYVPYVIEPSLGADRVLLAFLCNSYFVEADMSKFIASLIDFMNHDASLSNVMATTEKIHGIVEAYNNRTEMSEFHF